MLLASRDNGSFVLIFAPESWEKRLYWHRNTLPHRLLGARCSTNMESENALKEPFKRLSNLTIGPHFVIHGALPLRRILSRTRCSLRSYPPGAGLVYRKKLGHSGPIVKSESLLKALSGNSCATLLWSVLLGASPCNNIFTPRFKRFCNLWFDTPKTDMQHWMVFSWFIFLMFGLICFCYSLVFVSPHPRELALRKIAKHMKRKTSNITRF